MALIAESIGWRENEATGVPVFVVTLIAQTLSDVPDIKFGDILRGTPLVLTPAARPTADGKGDAG